MKTEQEIRTELDRLEVLDLAQNGPVYPRNSLHSLGFPSPTCSHCPAREALRWVLEEVGLYTLKARETANIPLRELDRAKRYSNYYENDFNPEARINNPSW